MILELRDKCADNRGPGVVRCGQPLPLDVISLGCSKDAMITICLKMPSVSQTCISMVHFPWSIKKTVKGKKILKNEKVKASFFLENHAHAWKSKDDFDCLIELSFNKPPFTDV